MPFVQGVQAKEGRRARTGRILHKKQNATSRLLWRKTKIEKEEKPTIRVIGERAPAMPVHNWQFAFSNILFVEFVSDLTPC